MVDEGRLSVELAHKEERPDFSVGYVYMQRDALPDMVGITLTTSLPVFHHRKQDMAIHRSGSQTWNPPARCKRVNSRCFANQVTTGLSRGFRRRSNSLNFYSQE